MSSNAPTSRVVARAGPKLLILVHAAAILLPISSLNRTITACARHNARRQRVVKHFAKTRSFGCRRPFRPPSRVWRWEMRRNARSCTRGRQAGSSASQGIAEKSGAVAPSKHGSSCNIWQTTQPVRANSTNSPGHPVNLSICTRLPLHLWVFSLLICSVRWGRSAVGRNVKYVRTEKRPFFHNG